MFPLNKFLLIAGGVAVAGTEKGLGIYYGIKGDNNENKEKVITLKSSEEKPNLMIIPKKENDEAPPAALKPKALTDTHK